MQEQCEFGGAASKAELAAGVGEDLGENSSGFSSGDGYDVSSATVTAKGGGCGGGGLWLDGEEELEMGGWGGGQGSGVAGTACRRWRPRLDGAAQRRGGAAAAIGAAEKWRTGEGCRRWCWNASPLIGAWAGGGRLQWRREEPDRKSSSGAGRAAAAGACAAMGPVPCGPARLSQLPEPARACMCVVLECAGCWLRRGSA